MFIITSIVTVNNLNIFNIFLSPESINIITENLYTRYVLLFISNCYRLYISNTF